MVKKGFLALLILSIGILIGLLVPPRSPSTMTAQPKASALLANASTERYYEDLLEDRWDELLGNDIVSGISLSAEYDQWDDARKEQMLGMYPISEKVLPLLREVRFMKLPYVSIDLGEDSTAAFAVPDAKLMVTSSVHPTQSLHEFSHIAFYWLVGDDEIESLAEDLYQEMLYPETGFEDISLCHWSPPRGELTSQELRELISEDPEHRLISMVERAEGNLNLIPHRLRRYTPWLKSGHVKNWKEVKQQFLSFDRRSKLLYNAMFLGPPFWCLGENAKESIFTMGEARIDDNSLYSDRVAVFKAATKDFLTDVVEKELWNYEIRKEDISWALWNFPEFFPIILGKDRLKGFKKVVREYEAAREDSENLEDILSFEYILSNFDEWKDRVDNLLRAHRGQIITSYSDEMANILYDAFREYIEIEFADILDANLKIYKTCFDILMQQYDDYLSCSDLDIKTGFFAEDLESYTNEGVFGQRSKWRFSKNDQYVKDIAVELEYVYYDASLRGIYFIDRSGTMHYVTEIHMRTREGQPARLVLITTGDEWGSIKDINYSIIPPNHDTPRE